jgi:hypothetical protein
MSEKSSVFDCGNAIKIGLIVVIIYLLLCMCGEGMRQDYPPRIVSGSPTIKNIADTEGFTDDGGDKMARESSSYDPLTMGAVKQSEVDAHYKNLAERSPFATVGTAGAKNVLRDDDEILRNTGVPWVFRPPSRSFKTVMGGPQDGARQVGSVTQKDITKQHFDEGKRSEYVW